MLSADAFPFREGLSMSTPKKGLVLSMLGGGGEFGLDEVKRGGGGECPWLAARHRPALEKSCQRHKRPDPAVPSSVAEPAQKDPGVAGSRDLGPTEGKPLEGGCTAHVFKLYYTFRYAHTTRPTLLNFIDLGCNRPG